MEHEAVVYFQETPMKIKIPLVTGPDEVADVRARALQQSIARGMLSG
jgi:hypothetical protein